MTAPPLNDFLPAKQEHQPSGLLATIGREAMVKVHDVSFFHFEEPALRLESVNAQAPGHLARQLTSE